MLGSGSVGAHPLTYSYGGSYQARPLATSFTGSHSHTHRVLGGVANTSYPDLEAAARAVRSGGFCTEWCFLYRVVFL